MLNEKKLSKKCFCGGENGELLGTVTFKTYDGHLLPTIHDIVSCEKCGFVFADIKSEQSVFNKYYEHYSKYEDINLAVGIDNGEKERIQGYIVQMIEERLCMDATSSIIDIVCGQGTLLKALKKHGYQNLYGLDPSKKCTDICASNGIHAFQGTIDNNIIDRRFDVVILDNVLEHVFDINDFIQKVLQLLNTEGYLVIRVPDARLYTPQFYPKAYSAFTIEHINHFDHQSIITLGSIHKLRFVAIGDEGNESPGILAVFQKNSDQRYLGAKSACLQHLKKSAEVAKMQKHRLKKKIKHSKIIIWGIGSYYSRLSNQNFFNDFEIIALVDRDKHKHNQIIDSMEILSPEEIVNIDEDFSIVVCAERCSDAIIRDIKKLEISKDIVAI